MQKISMENGKVIAVGGLVAPDQLGRVLMHEHLHSDLYDWKNNRVISEEKPNEERRQYLLKEAVPHLKACRDHGCFAYCDVTMPPWRAWPTLYAEVSAMANVHIVISTGFYREIELNTYFAKSVDEQIWPFVRKASMEKLADFCIREITEGIHGTPVRAGAIKLATSRPPMTPMEIKTFRAGARAQKQTGVHITTHCTWKGAETSQLTILDDEGVDLTRVIIGHTAGHIMDPSYRKIVIEWMKRGANFMPTNLGIYDKDPKGEHWRPLLEGIHEVFQSGHGDKLVLGLDSGYCSESKEFGPVTFLPPHPWSHMFTHTLPAFRKMGLTEEEEDWIMLKNPQRILPVRK